MSSPWTSRPDDRCGPTGASLPDDLRACCGDVNRGVAALGDQIFIATIDAHLVALDMRTGRVRWDVEVADYKTGHSLTPPRWP